MEPYIVIADPHGHAAKLEKTIRRHERDGLLRDHRLVILGDLYDRGPEIKSLVDLCINLKKQGHIVICGNHEYVLEKVLLTDDEEERDRWILRWLNKYECNTLSNYGIQYNQRAFRSALLNQRLRSEWTDMFKSIVPANHLEFIKSLPFFYETEQYIFIHAGVDPASTWKEQKRSLEKRETDSVRGPAQLFSRLLSLTMSNSTKKCLVTGHSVVSRPIISSSRVLLDCGVDMNHPMVSWVSDTNKLIYE